MKYRKLKILIWGFIFVTGALAATGLMLMDQSFKELFLSGISEPTTDQMKEYGVLKETLKLKEDRLNIYFMKIPQARYNIFLAHDGWNITSDIIQMFSVCREMNLSLCTFDYRIESSMDSSVPNEESLLKDTRNAYWFMRKKFPPVGRIIFYGQGIGVVPLSYLASRNKSAAFIMENPVPSLKSMMSNKIRRKLVGNRLVWKKNLLKVKSPVYFIFSDLYPLIQKRDLKTFKEENCKLYKCFQIHGNGGKILSVSETKEWKRILEMIIDELEKNTSHKRGFK